MAQYNINTGTLPNDKTGDSLRVAMIKVQNNFTELYTTAPISNSVNVGNTTSNVTVNSTSVSIGNSGTKTIANSSSITATSGYYTQVFNSGSGNLVIGTSNAASLVLYANNVTSAVIAANGNFGIGNNAPADLLTVGGTMRANQISVAGAFTINSTFVSTFVANNTNFVGTVSAANVVSNAQLTANLSNYQTTAGLSANVASLTANNVSFVGSVSAANVVSNAQLSANLNNYQTTAGLSANVGSILTTYSSTINASSHTTGSGFGTIAGGFIANVTTVAVGNSSANVIITANTISVIGIVNATSYNVGSIGTGTGGSVQNTTIFFVGNNTINTVISSAGLTVNGTATIANSSGVYTTGIVNAASHTTGASGTGTGGLIANVTTIFIGNNTVNAYLNTTGLNINTATIANTLGVYTSGTVNGSSITVGASTIANSTGVYTGIVNGSSITVGSVVVANSITLNANGFVVNSTGGYFTGLTNSTSFNTGAIGTGTGGSVQNTTVLFIGNNTINAAVNTTSLSIGGNLIANSTGANNAFNLNGNPSTYYTNATNITTGTLPDARLSSAVVNTSANFTIAGNTVFSGANNTITGTLRIAASAKILDSTGSQGQLGQVLASNGTSNVYWTDPGSLASVNTAAAYNWTNAHSWSNNNTILSGGTLKFASGAKILDSANSQGLLGQVLTSNGSSNVYWSDPSSLASVNTAAAYNWTNNHTWFSNLQFSAATITWVGNTTTSPTITLSNTGSLTIGNSSTTQTTSIISVANSSGNVQITPSGISGNGFNITNINGLNITSINATSITTGTLPDARLSSAVVNTSANFTIAGNTTFSAANNTISGTLRFSAGAKILDSTGSQGTVGQLLTSNGSSNVYWSDVSLNVNTAATYNWTNVHTWFANLQINSTSLRWVGNTSTSPTITLANNGTLTIGNNSTTQTTSIISVANSSGNVQITPSGISGNGISITTINATNITTGTLPYAQLGVNVVNTTANFTLAGNITLSNSASFTGTFDTSKANIVANNTLSDASGTINWDTSTGQIGYVTLTGTGRTMAAPTNLKVGTYILHIIQDATGSRTITGWSNIFKWPAGVTPVLTTTANSRDVFSFVSDGTNLYGSYIPDAR